MKQNWLKIYFMGGGKFALYVFDICIRPEQIYSVFGQVPKKQMYLIFVFGHVAGNEYIRYSDSESCLV